MQVTVQNSHLDTKCRLELVEGDITDQDTDAIVNAAHWDLAGGQGVDGRIHYKGGPAIMAECRRIGGCPIGDAVLTTGGNLKARFVIHTVGPVYEPDSDLEAELLDAAYANSLRVARDQSLTSIAFPSLSTGAFNYPMPLAAPIALRSILSFLRDEPHTLKLVRFVLFPDETPEARRIYTDALAVLLRTPEFAGSVFPAAPLENESSGTPSTTAENTERGN